MKTVVNVREIKQSFGEKAVLTNVDKFSNIIA